VRDTASELNVLESAGDLAESVGGHLAVLCGEEGRDLLTVRVDQLAHAEEDLGSLRQAGGSPFRGSGFGDGDGAIDLVDAGEVDGGRLLTGGRVVDGGGVARSALDDTTVDPVTDPLHVVLQGGFRNVRVGAQCK